MMICVADDGKDIIKYIELLSDKEHADEAFLKIRKSGYEAIPYLLEKSNTTDIYYGVKIYWMFSSVALDRPTVGLVCLYLIDSIIMDKDTPHRNPLIIRVNEKGIPSQTDSEVLKKAIVHYKKWWNLFKDIGKSKIKKVSPLSDNDEIYWF